MVFLSKKNIYKKCSLPDAPSSFEEARMSDDLHKLSFIDFKIRILSEKKMFTVHDANVAYFLFELANNNLDSSYSLRELMKELIRTIEIGSVQKNSKNSYPSVLAGLGMGVSELKQSAGEDAEQSTRAEVKSSASEPKPSIQPTQATNQVPDQPIEPQSSEEPIRRSSGPGRSSAS